MTFLLVDFKISKGVTLYFDFKGLSVSYFLHKNRNI
jgi:hypothetical protein